MTDRLCGNMLELVSKKQEQDSNRTLCNLNLVIFDMWENEQVIVIEHYVI